MKKSLLSLTIASLVALTAVSLTACQQTPQTTTETQQEALAMINIEAFYFDRSMLPPNAELIVTLEDVSKMDVAAEVISTNRAVLNSAPPYRITLNYDPTKVLPNMRYNVRAQIKKDGQLLYTSTASHNPFVGSEKALRIKLDKVARPALKKKPLVTKRPNAPLQNTYWKVITLHGDKVATPKGARELFLQMRDQNQVRGFAGCNNFHGQFTATKYGLRFNQIASTMMACADSANELETTMHKMLENTFEYTIKGDSLTLYNEKKEKIAYFEAVYFN